MRRALICIGCLIVYVSPLVGEEAMRIPIAKISLPDPGYVGMSIWMQVVSPTRYKVHYPSSTTPNDFYCNEVEVKLDGRLLRPLIGLPAGGRAGPACGWLGIDDIAESRLPIHLQYPLTEPGTYMVRFTRREYRRAEAQTEIAEQSDWVPLDLRSASPKATEEWLASELAMVPGSPSRLLEDVLPSLLASRDPRVLHLMIVTSYDTDSRVAEYAANSLELFDAEQVRMHLLSIVRERGPSDALGYLFGSRGGIVLPIAEKLVAASLLHLRSSVPAEVEGAVHGLSVLRDPYFHLPQETVTQIGDALQAEVDFIVSQKNEKAAWWVANFLGATRPPAGHALLWKLIEAGLATEQSLICVTWFHDPSDLARLASVAKQYNPSDPHGYAHSSVVMHLQTQYGALARPYLRDILASSKQTWVRTAAAQGLVLMNDRAGWEFFVDVIRQRPFYRDEMVRWLTDAFPVIRDADDAAIITFLESKLVTGTGQN